jgi:hypothetical protein
MCSRTPSALILRIFIFQIFCSTSKPKSLGLHLSKRMLLLYNTIVGFGRLCAPLSFWVINTKNKALSAPPHTSQLRCTLFIPSIIIYKTILCPGLKNFLCVCSTIILTHLPVMFGDVVFYYQTMPNSQLAGFLNNT